MTPTINAKDYPSKDAEEELWVRIMPIDGKCGNPRDPAACAIAIAGMRQHRLQEFVIYRRFSYALPKGETVYLRYSNSATVTRILADFDINRAHAERRIPEKGVNVVFRPPSRSASLGYTRSERRLALVNESKRKGRKDKKRKKRGYRTPDPLTLSGVRWGPVKRK